MHSTICADSRTSSGKLSRGKAFAGVLALAFTLFLPMVSAAQSVEDSADAGMADTFSVTNPEVEALLALAQTAMADGRVDEPPDNNALFYLRQAANLDPNNETTQLGLIAVQEYMIERAMALAAQMDFDSAEEWLSHASAVREEQGLVAQARIDITRIKTERITRLQRQAERAMDAGKFNAAEQVLIKLIAQGGQADTVKQLRQRMVEARIYSGLKPGQVIRDQFITGDLWAPESVVIPVGSFLMGSTKFEKGRVENESPQHRITFRQGFAIGQHEVSVAEFRLFVNQTAYKTDAERLGHSIVYDHRSGRLNEKDGMDWEMDYEGKSAVPTGPVIHVSWNDAQAYVNWLARGTGKSYRLPSEAEFEHALRAGGITRYWWGDGSPSTVVENLTGEGDASRSRRNWGVAFADYNDEFWGPAPVMSFTPNPFGLFDIGGNVGEWVSDCWHDTYLRAPLDGTAWINPGCDQRVIRGGLWTSLPDQTRSAYRRFANANYHDARIGFRIARDL